MEDDIKEFNVFSEFYLGSIIKSDYSIKSLNLFRKKV